jgi:type II secretory ATPase GspE/PulE/Tfp pilus assembly ATPase PilB-like protein
LGSVAQRLLRCVCENCKRSVPANEKLLAALDPHGTVSRTAKFYRGEGCKKCLGSGFSGRIPIFEIMPITSEITMAIEAGVPHSKLQQMAIDAGMVELSQAGLEQALAGRTSIEEVYFKTSGDRRSGESKPVATGRREGELTAH